MTGASPRGIQLPIDPALRHRIAVLSGVLAAIIFLSALLIESIDQQSTQYALDETGVETRPTLLHPLLRANRGGGRALVGLGRPDISSARVATLARRARRLCDTGNFHGAREFYKAILDLSPAHVEAQFALGSIALYERRYAAAEAYLGNLLEQLPDDDPVVRMRLGSAQFRRGRLGIGLANLQAALARAPGDGALCFELACVYATLGDRERACFYLECAYRRLGDVVLAFISDHHLDPIRDDQRFHNLLQQMRQTAAAPKTSDATVPNEQPQTDGDTH